MGNKFKVGDYVEIISIDKSKDLEDFKATDKDFIGKKFKIQAIRSNYFTNSIYDLEDENCYFWSAEELKLTNREYTYIEAIVELYNNPEKVFESTNDSKGGIADFMKYADNNGHKRICWCKNASDEYSDYPISIGMPDNKLLTEHIPKPPKQYTFQEAIEMWLEGKTIVSCNDLRYEGSKQGLHDKHLNSPTKEEIKGMWTAEE